ncbi:hypothetical protein BpHYR1_012659 [Brachionus plicatilis]|uniref:Uncharacterized protein n=1 Tax=Brachionus plicatilis TaxID=10195 RepID=A0A3M7SUS4_BRAPC|nr:hypothetical protein BpHYR1_012659 [Brachionus plicatilis]
MKKKSPIPTTIVKLKVPDIKLRRRKKKGRITKIKRNMNNLSNTVLLRYLEFTKFCVNYVFLLDLNLNFYLTSSVFSFDYDNDY